MDLASFKMSVPPNLRMWLLSKMAAGAPASNLIIFFYFFFLIGLWESRMKKEKRGKAFLIFKETSQKFHILLLFIFTGQNLLTWLNVTIKVDQEMPSFS